jgi:uncharacterized repeat protein (TIGR03803 family)
MAARRIVLALVLGVFGACCALNAQTLTVIRNFPTYPQGINTLPVQPLPVGSLIQASDGRLYGTETALAAGGYASVFRVNPDGSGYRVLFTEVGNAANVVETPTAVLQGRDGRLYGYAYPSGGFGRIFVMNTDGTGFANLYTFTGGNDGSGPNGLIQGSDGRLYGISPNGGQSGYGTVFSLGTDGSGFTVLHAGNGMLTDTAPTEILQGNDGRIYFVTTQSALSGPALMVINRDGTGLGKVMGFQSGAGTACVIQGSGGAFFAATQKAGQFGCGNLVSFNPNGSGYFNLYDFKGAGDGQAPSGLFQGSDGRLYGLSGVLFAVGTDGSGFVTLHTFSRGSDGSPPYLTPFQGSDGRIYGATYLGGALGGGTLYAFASGGAPPVFTSSPASVMIILGQSTTLSGAATGSPS